MNILSHGCYTLKHTPANNYFIPLQGAQKMSRRREDLMCNLVWLILYHCSLASCSIMFRLPGVFIHWLVWLPNSLLRSGFSLQSYVVLLKIFPGSAVHHFYSHGWRRHVCSYHRSCFSRLFLAQVAKNVIELPSVFSSMWCLLDLFSKSVRSMMWTLLCCQLWVLLWMPQLPWPGLDLVRLLQSWLASFWCLVLVYLVLLLHPF